LLGAAARGGLPFHRALRGGDGVFRLGGKDARFDATSDRLVYVDGPMTGG